MSLSTELPLLEAQRRGSDELSQHLIQPDATYWLTSESPITRAVSFGLPVDTRSSTGYAPAIASFQQELRPSIENFNTTFSDPAQENVQIHQSLPHLHLSELDTNYADVPSILPWPVPDEHLMFARPYPTNHHQHISPYLTSDYPETMQLQDPYSPYSTPSLYDDSPLQSPYLSSTDVCSATYGGRAPRSSPNDDYEAEDDDEEDVSDGKPYARLIFEALLHAPGHRMMLRDIYGWFEQNTNKPRESGSNGWQNSIRHNLSMNRAFENDKTQSTNARGQPKKATSVWFLTQEALRHGVQSTTRYRKTGGVRKTGISGSPDFRRQRSGAKGGRAARRAARLRRLEQSHSSWTPMMTQEDIGPFNHLVHAANYLNDQPQQYDSYPPTPSESVPYTPRSPVLRFESSLNCMTGGNLDTVGGITHELKDPDILFQHHFDAPLEKPY